MQQADVCPKLYIVIIYYFVLRVSSFKKNMQKIRYLIAVVKNFGYYIANKNTKHIVMNTYQPPNDVLDNASQ
jgi:hypothetical protein